jgi:hypothetical protein
MRLFPGIKQIEPFIFYTYSEYFMELPTDLGIRVGLLAYKWAEAHLLGLA